MNWISVAAVDVGDAAMGAVHVARHGEYRGDEKAMQESR